MTARLACCLLLAAGTLAAQPLYTAAPAGVETRWASPENPTGARGLGAQEKEGRKGRASLPIEPGKTLTLIDVKAGSGAVRRIWITIADRKPEMLRALRLRM